MNLLKIKNFVQTPKTSLNTSDVPKKTSDPQVVAYFWLDLLSKYESFLEAAIVHE